jgi:hypothetical protein
MTKEQEKELTEEGKKLLNRNLSVFIIIDMLRPKALKLGISEADMHQFSTGFIKKYK